MTIDAEAFETLRSEALSSTVPWAGHQTFAQVASWAVLAEERGPDTSWSRDPGILTWDRLRPRIHARVVFVALNMGTTRVGQTAADWANFHTGRADYKLARAIGRPGTREELEGAYITDFFKGLPTPTAAALRAHLRGLDVRARAETTTAMVALLERELAILQRPDPLLVGIGRDAERWLRAGMPTYDIVGITHYAHAVARDAYAEQLAAVADLARRRTA